MKFEKVIPRPRRALLALACGAVLSAACASAQPPIAEMDGAKLAIREAEQADAVALAPDRMQAARDRYTRAEGAMKQHDYLAAERMAEEATVDAKLAGATARAARAERSLEEVRRSQRALENEATQ